jgi:hypothetical protein
MSVNDPSKNIPTASSSDEQWIAWHKKLKKPFNKKIANEVFLYAWSKRGGVDSKANTRKLSNYLESQGIDIERSTLDNIGEGIVDVGSGILSFGKWMIIIPLGIGGLLLIMILVKLMRNPNQSIQGAMMLTPQGRAIKGAGGMKKLK